MKAFELTEEAKKEGFSGGSVVCSSMGHMFDIKAGLDEGDGVIYTNDDVFAEILRGYPALQTVPEDQIPADAKAVALPYIAAQQAPQVGPSTLQAGVVDVAAQAEAIRAEEVPAEHADAAENPDSPDEAITAGEEVSGEQSEEQSSGEQGSVLGRFGSR